MTEIRSIAIPEHNTIERIIIKGDLSALTEEQKLEYMLRMCDMYRLNPLTRPFIFINTKEGTKLYATKDCASQLRRIYGVSLTEPKMTIKDDDVIVNIIATLPDGRTEPETGSASLRGRLGEERTKQYMVAMTRAKRRATLNICGLGILDESEKED